jgi:uncharacterized lipoprotein YmbA
MRKYFIYILLILILSSCMSSPARRYYQLYLGEEEGIGEKTIDKTVLVERIEVDDLYDDFRVVYRVSPYQLNYYSYEFWADKPDKLIRDSITHYLLRKNVFQKVIQEISRGEPDILWKSKIHFVEEIDSQEAWYARLSMEIELVDFESKERLYYHQFDRSERLGTKSVAMVPVMLSKILEEELDKVVSELFRELE